MMAALLPPTSLAFPNGTAPSALSAFAHHAPLVPVPAAVVEHMSPPDCEPGFPLHNLVLAQGQGQGRHRSESTVSSSSSSAQKGWRSQRFCAYPLSIVFRFTAPKPVHIAAIQILAHHALVPSRLEFWITEDVGLEDAGKGGGTGKAPTFAPLGHVLLSDPSLRPYPARELKTVRIDPPRLARGCKVVVGGCWVSGGNLWGQASILSISFLTPSDPPSPLSPHRPLALPAAESARPGEISLPDMSSLPAPLSKRITEALASPPPSVGLPTSMPLPLPQVKDVNSAPQPPVHETSPQPPVRFHWDPAIAELATDIERKRADAVAVEDYLQASLLTPILADLRRASESLCRIRQDKLRAVAGEDFATAERWRREEERIVGEVSEKVHREVRVSGSGSRERKSSSDRASPQRPRVPPREDPGPTSQPSLVQQPGFAGDPDDRPIKPKEGYSGWTPKGSDMALAAKVGTPGAGAPVAPKGRRSPAKTKRAAQVRGSADDIDNDDGDKTSSPVRAARPSPADGPVRRRGSPTRGSPGGGPPASPPSSSALGPPDEPDPIPLDASPDVRAAADTLGDVVVASALTRRSAAVAEWGLDRIADLLDGKGASPTSSPRGAPVDSTTLAAAALVARTCLGDARDRVALRAVRVLLAVLARCTSSCPASSVVPRETPGALVDKIEHSLASAGAGRVAREAEGLLGELAVSGMAKDVGGAITRAIPTGRGRAAHPRVAKGRAMCVAAVVKRAGTHLGGGGDGIGMGVVHGFALVVMKHPAGDAREAGVQMLVEAVKACKTGVVEAADKVAGWLERGGVRGRAVEAVREVAGKGGGKGRSSPSPPQNPAARRTAQLQSLLEEQRELRDKMAGNVPRQAPSGVRERDGHGSDVPERSGQRTKRTGQGQSAKGATKGAGGKKKGAGGSAQAAGGKDGRKVYTKNEEVYAGDWNIDKACVFCLEQNESFNEEALDLHYWKDCPMLANCPRCKQIVEVPTLSEHVLRECSGVKHGQVLECPRCKEPVDAGEFKAHVATKKCQVAPRPPAARCPLCHADVARGDSDDCWREHLIGVCPANGRRVRRAGARAVRQAEARRGDDGEDGEDGEGGDGDGDGYGREDVGSDGGGGAGEEEGRHGFFERMFGRR
ncbi:hypothetical protein M427DRAFT_212945 [Gonapodya prolifera JEL478]|uniref:TOG domain-containing protein n=1 Tax=Gonapodya prolifera (strain JEL478) TaxID=1344416 RepID=A0A138ZZ20_GONPJ|nr:hypothetical protein M427DRAFT_212945 [Gonapodya prolifera JEL478]|eukprot:KXS09762.1 hypothetical protein M427DRAFT_212945 [Gonapodya prolifera JEL478]